jgi:hypothetical protein
MSVCMWTAAKHGQLEVVIYLLGKQKHICYHPVFMGAVKGGRLEVFEFLRACGHDIRDEMRVNGRDYMYAAAMMGHLEVFKYLYEHGCILDE